MSNPEANDLDGDTFDFGRSFVLDLVRQKVLVQTRLNISIDSKKRFYSPETRFLLLRTSIYRALLLEHLSIRDAFLVNARLTHS